jgi:ATP-dependent RNA helicase HelY
VIIDPGPAISHSAKSAPVTRLWSGAGPLALTKTGKLRRLPLGDLAGGIKILGHIRVSAHFTGKALDQRLALLERASHQLRDSNQTTSIKTPAIEDNVITELRKQLKHHPVHACPERENHARWAHRLTKTTAELQRVTNRVEQRTESIARDFDKVCQVLLATGYLVVNDGVWQSTPQGQLLGRIYAERDIIIAQSLTQGIWQDASPAELAGIVTALVYESRRGENMPSNAPPTIAARLEATQRLAAELAELETAHKVQPTPGLDLSACAAMLTWANGGNLADVLNQSELSAGDFVRLASQVVEILGQLGLISTNSNLAAAAEQAIRQIRRGVVRAFYA